MGVWWGSVDKELAAICDTGTNFVSLKRTELEFVGPVFRLHFVKFLSRALIKLMSATVQRAAVHT